MIDDAIIVSNLNDFIFCPVSIYFHNLYGNRATITYQSEKQINGSYSHESIDNNYYSTSSDFITSLEVYSSKYNIVGKIDLYDASKKMLVERKRQIKTIYDGYIFQLYALYFGMEELGYEIERLRFHSMVDNRNYEILLPSDNNEMLEKFEKVVQDIRLFDIDSFMQTNVEKCLKCIYEPACDRSLV